MACWVSAPLCLRASAQRPPPVVVQPIAPPLATMASSSPHQMRAQASFAPRAAPRAGVDAFTNNGERLRPERAYCPPWHISLATSGTISCHLTHPAARNRWGRDTPP
ncbi:hypothetical protein BU16DRAFT_261895 [Lophium mytilinum]|uniref:Uncharacterized protein n=1 Tax=Lophium mytilinum TaxID=390894 RepID=A0A6A6R4A0_9PEZI|nr:hypothetical protein BU16DRAFT_261895 [Lophium mytilinum]